MRARALVSRSVWNVITSYHFTGSTRFLVQARTSMPRPVRKAVRGPISCACKNVLKGRQNLGCPAVLLLKSFPTRTFWDTNQPATTKHTGRPVLLRRRASMKGASMSRPRRSCCWSLSVSDVNLLDDLFSGQDAILRIFSIAPRGRWSSISTSTTRGHCLTRKEKLKE